MKNDIKAYGSAEDYLNFQDIRPDYTKAILAFLSLARKYLKNKKDVVSADFCSGPGQNTLKLTEAIGKVKKSILIDINEGFIKKSKSLDIKTERLETIYSDASKVVVKDKCDVVLSLFAYHHIEDNKKDEYIKRMKNCLKGNGIIILAEIYLPNKEIEIKYYDKLFASISKGKVVPGLKEFLDETARSTNFEFKVSKDFADKQFSENGLEKIEEIKIWPLDNSFSNGVGMFLQVYRLGA